MRIALLSPYSWTYPGGVTRHVRAIAESFLAEGHDVRVLAPYDPPDRASAVLHRGARPPIVEAPDYLVPLGRTIGFPANGSVSNLSITPYGVATALHELRGGGYDVVHIHEPVAPVPPWVVTDWVRLPLVGTFHTYNETRFSNSVAVLIGARRTLNHLHVRIAVSEAAAWTARRFFGGRYRIVPNGAHLPSDRPMGEEPRSDERLRIVFVGQAVERKGLPVVLRAFEALREHIPTELTVIGPRPEELEPMMLDTRQVRMLGRIDDETKHKEIAAADVLVAPSLRGESFGLVLTEAFTQGTPVVASNIPGYRDVLRDGIDGVLVPPGDAQALAEALRDLHEDPSRRRQMAAAAAQGVERFAWPRVTAQLMEAYEDAIETPAPQGTLERAAVSFGVRPADLKPRVPAQRLPSLELPVVGARRGKALRLARRGAVVVVSLLAAALAWIALQKIGISNVGSALVNSSPTYVLLGLAIMCSAMFTRAISWHAILKAALPKARIKFADATQGTFIGVLMSATLPARLGEPARALVVARRTGRARENLPVVLGSLVSQTILNLVALAILGGVMFSSVDIFSGHENALLAVAIVPALLLVVVLSVPALMRTRFGRDRASRLHTIVAQVRGGLARVRDGLRVFRHPRLGLTAAVAQLAAWGLQCTSCYMLLVALGLSHRTGFGAAAAVLFAVNITAVLPATPSNVGVFQAACAAVLHTGWHVGLGAGVAYGVILQAVEISTSLLMGTPALLKEGMSWREVKMRAMHTTPVKLAARPSSGRRTAGAVGVES
jgi:phosphatidyl-myo-inositol alpha-mannosyltransferase